MASNGHLNALVTFVWYLELIDLNFIVNLFLYIQKNINYSLYFLNDKLYQHSMFNVVSSVFKIKSTSF